MGNQALISCLDTNVAIFLHSGDAGRLPPRAISQLERSELLVSAIVMLELEMLYEKGVLRYQAAQILADLSQQLALSVCQLPMALVMGYALRVKWTRDPGDRVIVANAMANNDAPLITSDRRIQAEYPNVIW
jgi:PIN domain nuclease of toxin-antitoxin system